MHMHTYDQHERTQQMHMRQQVRSTCYEVVLCNVLRALTYVSSGCTHSARLLGSVQGVVVQATREAPSRAAPAAASAADVMGKATWRGMWEGGV
jgi:hypothetical protein